jgi:parallel beta-helix repeat protein
MISVLMILCVNLASARTWHVPTDAPTIKQAVEDSAAYGDTVLVSAGVYDTLTGESFPINMGSGIVLTSESGASVTTIDAGATASVISCVNCDLSTEISGFTITGGRAQSGGGIYCSQSNPTIRDNIIRNNTAISSTGGGGGIYFSYSEPTIVHNTISENVSQYRFGGGIYGYFSFALIERNTVAYNTSQWGGGIFNDNSSPIIRYNIIKGNHSILSGAGLDCYMNSSPDIIANVVVGNSAGTDGAGIACCYGCTPLIQYNTIACNVGDFGGGVRSFSNSSPSVFSNIIVDNVDALYLTSNSGLMLANDNNLYHNSYQPYDHEVVNNIDVAIDITNNFWWFTDAPSIGSLIYGPANFEPFHISPPANTPNEPSSVISVTAMTDSTFTTPLTDNLQIGDTVYIRLTGVDWHGSYIEPALVILRTALNPTGIAVALIETDTSTGIYHGWACVSSASDDALNHIGANQNDTLVIVSHIDETKRDTVYIGNIGIQEDRGVVRTTEIRTTQIISGPLSLPKDRICRIFDIAGRVAHQENLRRGIYFLEIDGNLVGKIIKIE